MDLVLTHYLQASFPGKLLFPTKPSKQDGPAWLFSFHFTLLYCHLVDPAKVTSKRGKGHVAAAAKSLRSCPTLCDPIDGSPPGCPRPWDSPGKNTGVGCHFLLQCVKMKSESDISQSCPTLSDPMDCSLPGSSVHGISQARILEWGVIAFSEKGVQRKAIP